MAPKPTNTQLDDVIVEAVEGSFAEADKLLADSAEASMHPDGLVGSEIDEYMRASSMVARFLETWQTPQLTFPVAKSPTEPGVDTMAAAWKKANGGSDTLAIEESVRKISNLVHATTASGALRFQQARIIASSEAADTDGVRLWVVEMPPSALTKNGLTHAVIALYPVKKYTFTDRRTGELVTNVDTGKVDPVRDKGRKIPSQVAVWAGNGGIVRMLTTADADRLALDWMWDGETENTAWALSTCRRLERLSERRGLVGDMAEREPIADIDPYSQPF
jgi:hypothetical protein